MDSPASTGDVVGRWRPFKANEQPVAETRLEDAWRLLRRLVPDLVTRLEDSTDPEAVEAAEDLRAEVVRVLADAVIRVLEQLARGGASVRRTSAEVDDGGFTREYVESSSTRALHFTDDELAAVSADPSDEATGGAFSVVPS